MDSEVKLCRSLPPLVEGKIHGHLKLTVDEIVWSRRSPGDVAVLASWWGELDSAQFRPADIKTGMTRLEDDTVETYTIRTNVNLFEEYLKNCETIELVVVSEKIHQVIGTAHVTELLDIFEAKSYSRYFPILNNSGNRIGDIHVAIKLLNVARLGKTTTKAQQFEDKVSFPFIDSKLKYDQKDFNKDDKTVLRYKESNPLAIKNAKHNENTYKSVLKDKRIRFEDPLKKFNMEVTDKLVAQVVARAQRLRGAILKETRNEDPLALSETSTLESLQSDTSVENEAKLYEYFLGKKMSQSDERKALETLRSMSPTPSLIDLASETIQSCQHNNVEEFKEHKDSVIKSNHVMEEILSRESVYSTSKESSPLDLVDSLKIAIESLTLTSAGYRRVRSSCLSRGDGVPVSITYFVQYDTMFTSIKKTNKKSENENRPTKLCSKKQVGQIIYFNHQAVYDIPKSYVHMDIPLKFKIFNRHLNQRTPTELGVGSMYISDVSRTECLSTTQKLAIVNKGIKIGELKITVEFGCDRIHFGKHFVDAVTSTKENIPVYEVSSSISAGTDRYKTVTGTESKSNSRVSSASAKRVEYTNGENSIGVNSRNNLPEQRKQNTEDRTIGVDTPEESSKDKVLLHGLIYIAEGKELSQSSTYLICRAFWREDRAASRLCSNTENPFYHFHQLVPILHGPDLLERTKDNCIVTEVYSRSSAGVDALLGIAKLPVHQLYVAYRDPLVLPHLLLSKYPVISVDGWVPIADPVTGQLCGQLLALVALGTADQIALLEMTRGLRDCAVTPRVIHNYTHGGRANHCHGVAQLARENNCTSQDPIVVERASSVQNVRCQECQTDITTVRDIKSCNVSNERAQNEALQSQSSVLHVLVDRLAQVLNVPKSDVNRTAEAQTVGPNGVKSTDTIEQLCLNPSRCNSLSEDSSNSSPRENFHMPAEMYRSVGVGAEFDETTNQGPSVSYGINVSDSSTVPQRRGIDNQLDSDVSNDDDSSFRAVVEIECALHLPKMEKPDGAFEPSTFVTFQKVQNGSGGQFGSYMITNVCLNSCNPKWEWRCDTRLSTELLVNDEKRMILKVWRLADPDASTKVDLEKDIVIGFSAIDLSVLSAGFPLVSGWFHIMDFTGKCNGQIKVSITPLESVPSFVKSTSTTSMVKILPSVPDSTRSHWSPSFPQDVVQNSIAPNGTTNCVQRDTDELTTSQSHLDNDPMPEMGLGFGDTSISFLSLSLKQKLTELDEITKRLQSRLHDVTNAAFDDDFDNDFDPNEPDTELENNENGNVDDRSAANTIFRATENWETLPVPTSHSSNSVAVIRESRKSCFLNEVQTQSAPRVFSGSSATTDTGYSTSSNVRPGQNASNASHEVQNQNENCFTSNNDSSDNNAEHPIRGTKVHINHLLDKLFTATPPPPPKNSAVRRNIVDFISSLRHNNNNNNNYNNNNNKNNNNNIESDGKCNQEINVRTVPTQTDNEDVQNQVSSLSSINLGPLNVANANDSNDVSAEPCPSGKLQKRSRVSALIRDELVAEENNDTLECDDLSAQLITSNVRHMDLDSIFNPLLYQHLIPDVQNLNAIPEGEAVEQLDNRYAETFNATVNNGLSRLRSLVDIDASLIGDSDGPSRSQNNLLETSENMDIFRLTPSGLSESIDGNIDVTVIHKPANDDLMASNSTESTTTISFDKSSARQTDKMDDASSLTSSLESVSTVSRQAPDGGNPVEETGKLVVVSHRSDSQDSSTDS